MHRFRVGLAFSRVLGLLVRLTVYEFFLLFQVQLPLYLMKEQVSIEMFFETDQKKRLVYPKGATAVTAVEIDTSQTKLVADYIYYPQPVMDNYEAQIAKTGLTIPILIQLTFTRLAVARRVSSLMAILCRLNQLHIPTGMYLGNTFPPCKQ